METETFQITLGIACLLIGTAIGWIGRGPFSRRASNRAVDRAYRRIEDRHRKHQQ